MSVRLGICDLTPDIVTSRSVKMTRVIHPCNHLVRQAMHTPGYLSIVNMGHCHQHRHCDDIIHYGCMASCACEQSDNLATKYETTVNWNWKLQTEVKQCHLISHLISY